MTPPQPRIAPLIASAREGAWLTVDRLRSYATVALCIYACLLAYMALVLVYPILVLPAGHTDRPYPGDFSQVWVAGRSVLEGYPLAPYDLIAHQAHLRDVWGPHAPLYAWVYPPFCLAAAALLALLPSTLSVAIEQALMLALYAKSIRAILPQRLALMCAVALPSVIINVGYGQIATLTAGLAGAAAVALDRRPALAGVLFGCMAYKPQLGVAIPIALLAGRRWAALLAGAATVAVLVAASTAAFGWHSWLDFFASMRQAGNLVFEHGQVDWYKIQSVFSASRLIGSSARVAWVVQVAAALLAMAGVVWAWRQPVDTRLKTALLLVAGLLCTPYCFEYDTVVFGPAMALAVSYALERGFVPWEKTLLALFWVSPLIAGLVARTTHIPLGALSIAGFTGLLLRKIAVARTSDSGASQVRGPEAMPLDPADPALAKNLAKNRG